MQKLFIVIGLVWVVLSSNCFAENSNNTVKVAAIFAKSGQAAEDNLELFQAVRFAVEEVNRKGGVYGRRVELREYDNHSTPIQSRQAAKKAVADGAVAVIGASWSSHSLAMAPYLQKMKIPMISPDSTNPKVTAVGDYIFRACFNDIFQGKTLARFARDYLHSSTAVIAMNVSSDYSIGLSGIFTEHFEAGGGKVLATLNYKFSQTDFRDLLEEAKAMNADVLFVPGHAESGFIVRQAQEIGVSSKMLGGDGWPYRQFYANGGQDLKEGYYTAHWSKELDNEKSINFITRYNKSYEISEFATTSYDAAMLLFDAMQRAKTLESKSIRDALAATKDFEGVTGKISFDESGDPVKQTVIMKITNGRPSLFRVINPE